MPSFVRRHPQRVQTDWLRLDIRRRRRRQLLFKPETMAARARDTGTVASPCLQILLADDSNKERS
jgi:hypothetical protein